MQGMNEIGHYITQGSMTFVFHTSMFTQGGDEWKQFPKSVATRAHYCRHGIHAEVAHRNASPGKYRVVMNATLVLKIDSVH